MASSSFACSRPVQRKSWMMLYPDSGPEACSILREKCPELEIDEFYSARENGKWYSLLHLERKVRVTAVERGMDMLTGCGVNDVRILEFDGRGDSQASFAVLERHLAERDAGVVVWVKPGKTRSVVISGAALAGVMVDARSKRLRSDGPIVAVSSSMEVEALRRLLDEKDAQLKLAQIERESELKQVIQAKDEEVRLMLLKREEKEDGLLDAKEDEIASLRTRAEECDSVIVRMAADISHWKAECTRGLQADTELKKRRGDYLQREIELAVDLNAERSRVVSLREQVASFEADNASALNLLQSQNQKLKERVSHLEGDIQLMQKEAIIWEQDRERRGVELESSVCELRTVRLSFREVSAKLKEEEQAVKELRQRAVEIVRFESESVSELRIKSLQNSVLLMETDAVFRNKEWKRRVEALRDELCSVRKELVAKK